jgi:AcrR family transcriptional regulator
VTVGPPHAAWPAVDDPDRTARARIRDAAIARFAEGGFAATSLKTVADDVGVSPPLVIHHFGSKEGLRKACDEYVAAAIRQGKQAAMAAGRSLDPLEAMRQAQQGPPLLKYLSRTLGEGSPHVAALIDELVEDAVGYMAEGVDSGLLKPSEFSRERAVVLLIWNLGALVLHEHVERLLGVDLTAGDDPERLLGWMVPAFEILARGVLDEAVYQQWRESAQDLEHR